MLDHFLSYLEHQKAYSVHTLNGYRNDVLELERFLQKEFELTVESAQREHLRSWLVWMLDQRQLQASSVARKMASIRAFYKFLIKQNRCKLNPALGIQLPKKAEKLPVVVRAEELSALLSSSVFPDQWEGHRDRLILEVFYQTGIRRAELIGLKWSDWDENSQQLRVIGKRRKERIIPLSTGLQEKLSSFQRLSVAEGFDKEPYIFTDSKGRKVSESLVYKVVNHYLGLTHSSKNSPHVLRHSFATHMLDNGADLNAIKELLGHANLAATQVYTHNSLEKVKSVYNQAHPKSRKKTGL